MSRTLQRLVLLSVLCVLGAGRAWADGPVATPPGGVSVNDNDTTGEKWGRTGGRTLTYSVTQPANFSVLNWGIQNGTFPSAAFDGNINANTPEVLTFDNGTSNLAGGIARWTGQGVMPLFGGASTTLTRFTMTVTNNNLPVTLTFNPGSSAPGINALTTPTFQVNLLFEAWNGSAWQPLLDLYDQAATPPGNGPLQGGPVRSEIQVGFYYTAASSGGTQLDTIQSDVTTIKTDVNQLKLNSTVVNTNLAALSLGLTGISQQLGALSNQLPPDLGTTLATAVQQLNSANTALTELQTLLQGALKTLDVTGYKEYRTDAKKVWLITSTFQGTLVNATLAKVLATVPKTTGAAAVFDVTGVATVAQIVPGVLEVTLSSVPTGAQVFQFQMQYVVGGDTATGSILLP